MTKTTTTCDTCGTEIYRGGVLSHPSSRIECVEYWNEKVRSTADFCSRSCLSEYLKPKTETTP